MENTNKLTAKPINKSLLVKLVIPGAVIGLIVALMFIRSAGEGDPNWPTNWMVRPLIILTLAGATGGAFSYYFIQLTPQGGWRRVLAIILSLIVCLVGLWMGIVLGFDGTLWD